MSKIIIAVGLWILSTTVISAQNYRWQQAVSYTMDIEMNAENHTYDGQQSLRLTNNSPDTLRRVFYHLYFNAFQPNSMMDVRSRTIADPDKRVGDRISKLTPDQIGYQRVNNLQQDGQNVTYRTEGTILEVELDHPILPGASSIFEMEYKAQVPLQVRRSGRDSKEGVAYTMTQWYPKMCEYDEQGWHANPYIGREFYGIWGDYDVTIYIDRNYILGGTGTLINADDIGYGYSDRTKKPKKDRNNKAKWHFKADQVHDFAWAADREYVHETHMTKTGVTLHTLYKKDIKTKDNWKQLPIIMDEALSFINQHFGAYPYDQFSIIQGGDGGMEYPMSTMITGNRPINSLVGVTVHEMLHSWYHGVLGSNESLYPWMDEGFTTYAQNQVDNHLKCQALIEGDCLERDRLNNNSRVIELHNIGQDEAICTHADHYTTNRAYSIGSYHKGSVFLSQLAYIMGTESLDRGLLRYFKEWQFKHPNDNDVIRIMEKESGMELDWYREYWVNSTKMPDYAVDTVLVDADGQQLIRLSRRGDMPMPIDLMISYKDGTKSYHTIPLRIMRGQKAQEGGISYQVESDWPWTFPGYEFRVPKDVNITRVEIDPSGRMADINRDNNIWE